MTTTSKFQILPDFYNNLEDCIESEKKYINTNPRYSDFFQTHFTAGDILQFQEYRDMTNENLENTDIINLDNNIFNNILTENDIYWDGYKDLEATSVDNTFLYLFNKFKKGIFIKIKDNELKVFLPFSKNNFINEWGDKIKYDPKKYKNMNEFLEYISNQQGYKFNSKKVNKDTNTWYSNNCLVRYEFPLNEGDSGVHHMSDMIKTLCKTRKIPDIEFFINRRDFPLLKRDYTEPYDNIFDNQPLLSHKYDKYSPILGGAITNEFSDISIPTWKDWARICSDDNKFFFKTNNEQSSNKLPNIQWEDRLPTAIFRGASTGCGVTKDTNPRLKLAHLSSLNIIEDGYKLLDAGITKWNLRPRKIKGCEYLQTIHIKDHPPLVNYLTPSEQCKYKYIVNVDGHVTAFRLSLELSMGSVILLAESKYSIWFMKYLEPYKHFIPIKSDLSDLFEKIRWCRNNDIKCKEISINANNFYKKYLTKNGILDYLQIVLVKLKNIIGKYIYNFKDSLEYQIEYENKMLYTYNYFPKTTKILKDINFCPKNERYFSTLKGIEWVFNFIKYNCKNDNISLTDYFNIKNLQPILTTKNTIIYKTFIAEYPIILKFNTEKSYLTNYNEIIHESFISHNVTNNFIKKIPNFEYIFGFFDLDSVNENYKKCICAEYIDTNLTFDKYIYNNYNKLNKCYNSDFLNNYVNILLQISFALDIAQKEGGFVHNDLMPWNILIKEYDSDIKIDYNIDNKIYTIFTKIVPIIIDYGKSHVIYNGIHYGINNRYKTSTINDLVMILIKSLKIITINEIQTDFLNNILYISNFISNTQFYRKKFNKISDLKIFLNNTSQYTNLLISEKYELEKYTSYNFIKYINLGISTKLLNKVYIKMDISDLNFNYTNDFGNPKQVFDFILCNNSIDRIDTYLNVFNNIKTISEKIDYKEVINNNIFLLYIFYQNLEQQIESNRYVFQNYLNSFKSNDMKLKYQDKLNNIVKSLNNYIYSKFIYQLPNCIFKDINYNFDINLYKEKIILFDTIDLLDPKLIYNKIVLYNKYYLNIPKYKNISKLKDIIISVLFNTKSLFKMDEFIRKYYIEYFKDLLNINITYMNTNIANINTLIHISNIIYKDNIEKMNLPKKYIDIYNDIFKINDEINRYFIKI